MTTTSRRLKLVRLGTKFTGVFLSLVAESELGLYSIFVQIVHCFTKNS